jgi:iron complex outermembrane recepter protein
VRFTEAGSLQNRFDDQEHRGLIGTFSWQISDAWRLEGGADAEQQDVIEQRFGTIGFARVRNTASVLRNRQFEFDTTGLFLRADYAYEDRFGLNVGVRVDELDGDYVQFSATGMPTPRNIYDFGNIVQPKANLFFKLADPLTLFANYGRSFQHPLSADAFTTGATNTRDVSRNNGYEIGGKWQATENADLRLSFWQQKAEDEFVLVDGTAQNVGQTKRDGIDFSANVQLNDALSLWANYTTVDSEIVKPASTRNAFIGNELRSIPDHTGSLGLSFQASEAWNLRLHLDRQGDYYVNEANLGGQFGNYTLLHANVDYLTQIGSIPTKFSLQLNNMTDRYHEYVFDFSENGTDTIHSPGDGRSFSLTAGFKF